MATVVGVTLGRELPDGSRALAGLTVATAMTMTTGIAVTAMKTEIIVVAMSPAPEPLLGGYGAMA
jgi:hypothetical protein